MGAPRPGSQTRVEEGLLGDSDKFPLPAFEVGEQGPREGTRPDPESHGWNPRASSSPYPLSDAFSGFNAFNELKLSLSLKWNFRVSSTN